MLLVAAKGNGTNPIEPAGSQMDRLPDVEDCLDDFCSEAGQGQGATDLGDISVAPREVS